MSDHTNRVISHMNKDHKLSLVDYVVVYGNQPESTFHHDSVNMTDVNTKHVVLEYIAKSDPIKKILTIDWDVATEDEKISVKEFSDIKSKLISMAKYSAKKQGYSHIQIKKVLYPGVNSIPLFLILISLSICIYDLQFFKSIFRNDLVFQQISPFVPNFLWRFLNLLGKHAKYVLGTTLLVHIIEITAFTIPKTKYYRVPTHQRLIWMFMHFFEGFILINRFKTLIPK